MDKGEPDVYETSDLPEVDQPQSNAELESESVEKLVINVDSAFNQFKGKSVIASNIDFSDRIGESHRTGYYIPRSEYELLGEGDVRQKKETPEIRLQRLQLEIKELAEDLSQIKENVRAESSTPSASAVTLTKQVEYLNQQLKELSMDKLLSDSSAGIDMAGPHGALQKRVMTELDAYKAREKVSDKGGKGTEDKGGKAGDEIDPDHMTFKLFYRPEQAKFSNNARVADLEQRLDRLECLLGPQQTDKLTILTSEAGVKNLLGVVSSLMARVKMLDLGQMDLVEARLSSISHRLNQLNDKKETLEQAGKISKVSELYDLMSKWEPVSASLPSIVERLTLLKDLHEQALQFGQTMSRLDATQQQIETQLKSQTSLLKQVDGTVSGNVAVIQSNCESLANRLKALNK